MKKTFITTLLALSAALPGFDSRAETPPDRLAKETPPQHAARMAWWREARFGMFIHYGPVTLTGKELSWSRANSNTNCPNHGPTPVAVYDTLYQQFNPTNFNATEWADIAKLTGMKYMVLTAKHGDGFLLWDSKVDAYNIMASPFHRDLCAELAQAARKAGLHMGWYFSPMDWRDPDCRSTNNTRFVAHMQDELRELLTHYGQIDVMWFDSDGRPTMWSPETTYPLVRGLQPQIIIDNRLQLDTSEQWANQEKLTLRENEDFYTPEQKVGAYDDRQPWESCMTLGTQWSWKPNDQIKSAAEVISILAQTVGGDGNLLLDVGPMPDGRMEPRQVAVLKKVGAWMDVNGESIYGTRGGPWKPTKQIASTRKGNVVYVFVLNRDQTEIELPALPRKIISARVLDGGSVSVEPTNEKIVLHLEPRKAWTATVIKLQLDGSAMDIPAMTLPEPKPVKATQTNQPRQQVSQQNVFNVLDYGAVGDDKTDNTEAFSACLKAVITAGGGRMFLPDGVYRGRILIPPLSRPLPSWITIEIAGESEPTPVFGTIGNFPLQNHGTIVKCLAPTGPAVISATRSPESFYWGFSAVYVVLKNLDVRTDDNPGIGGIDLNYAIQAKLENVFVNTGVYSVQAAKPTHATSGLITPANNNAALTILRNVVVTGFHTGILVNEHTDGDNINLACNFNGLEFPFAHHASRFGRVGAYRCTHNIAVTGRHAFSIEQLDMEIAGPRQTDRTNEWQATEYNVDDPKNLGIGDLNYWVVEGNVGAVEKFTKNGGAAIQVRRLGSVSFTDADQTNISAVSAARVKQLQDLRWGLFVCWSFSTFSGKEWTPGVTNLDLFAAKDCDTDQWAKTAKDAGMGYILFLTKHHDGFCLWDTQTTDRKVTKAALGRDVLAELKKSCDKYGLKLALYFSEGEWAWPGGVPGEGFQRGHIGKNPEMKKAQLEELLTRYGPVEYIWFDNAVGDGGLSHSETVRWVKKFQPDCFVGFNSGAQEDADIRLGEEGHPAPLSDKAGAGFNQHRMGDQNNYRLAEFTYPILPKHQGGANWFYSLPKHDQLCLPAEKIYADYLGAVKFGNIFSLDVGPDYNGRLRAIDVETLRQVGEMIRTHAVTMPPASE